MPKLSNKPRRIVSTATRWSLASTYSTHAPTSWAISANGDTYGVAKNCETDTSHRSRDANPTSNGHPHDGHAKHVRDFAHFARRKPNALLTAASLHLVRSWWTGSRWLLMGTAWLPSTTGSESSVDVGLAYDPIQDRWDVIDPGPLTGFTIDAVWSGSRLFAFDPSSGLSSFDPATNSWSLTAPGPLDDIGATSPDGGPALAWTGTEVFIWGGARKARDTSRCIDSDPSAFVYG